MTGHMLKAPYRKPILLLLSAQFLLLLTVACAAAYWLSLREQLRAEATATARLSQLSQLIIEDVHRLELRDVSGESRDSTLILQAIARLPLEDQDGVWFSNAKSGVVQLHTDKSHSLHSEPIPIGSYEIAHNDEKTPIQFVGANESLPTVSGRMHTPLGDYLVTTVFVPHLQSHLTVGTPADLVDGQRQTVFLNAFLIGSLTALVMTASLLIIVFALERSKRHQLDLINANFDRTVSERIQQRLIARDHLIMHLSELIESRDSDHICHISRVREYSMVLARHLSKRRPELNESFMADFSIAVMIHDLGKASLPDPILTATQARTEAEQRWYERHTIIGGESMERVRKAIGPDSLIEMAEDIALGHHERWDGKGFPYQHSEESIPLSARLFAVADAYEELTRDTPQRPAFNHMKAARMIVAGYATYFDPEIVEVFVEAEDDLYRVSQRFRTTTTAASTNMDTMKVANAAMQASTPEIDWVKG
jgi:HD-GYP domain-containing protein (c-di-GMP phosphodiesterase class II)